MFMYCLYPPHRDRNSTNSGAGTLALLMVFERNQLALRAYFCAVGGIQTEPAHDGEKTQKHFTQGSRRTHNMDQISPNSACWRFSLSSPHAESSSPPPAAASYLTANAKQHVAGCLGLQMAWVVYLTYYKLVSRSLFLPGKII